MKPEADVEERLASLLAALAGQALPFPDKLAAAKVSFGSGPEALGHSQLNELLLLVGLDRLHPAFFAFILDGTTSYTVGSGFESLDELEDGVRRFQKVALLLFGNVKFAFKRLSTDPDSLRGYLEYFKSISEEDFAARHDPILPVQLIAPEDAYLTGYLVERELKARLEDDAEDSDAKTLMERRNQVLRKAIRNQEAYYASDHMDVYVATSMREQHEFAAIHGLTKEIFGHPKLAPLKLRYFDPTQAVCTDRIDKGLAEALMLRRATCTIYLAQVSDTLGKDSELASTLAQGKPVIAFVPKVTEDYLSEYLRSIIASHPDRTEVEVLLDQLRVFDPAAAWTDQEVIDWLSSESGSIPVDTLRERLKERIRARYDSRARTLKESHPLAIQVNLETGVANGVLVARTVDECARLVHGILTRTLKFELDETDGHTLLRESTTKSIFRVMTKDDMLTNTFWNFYLSDEE